MGQNGGGLPIDKKIPKWEFMPLPRLAALDWTAEAAVPT
jgi:hypothetical protein